MKFLVSTLLLGLVLNTSAHALTLNYETNSGGVFGGGSGWQYDSISASFDDATNLFTWAVDHNSSPAPNAFWLVISDGHNPKGDVNEYAIWYGDYTAGTLTAYEYNGTNSSNSWATEAFIGDFSFGLTSDDDVLGFSVDVSGVNSFNPAADWDGTQFADNIGIWFHPFMGEITLNNDGSIYGLDIDMSGWFDTNYDGDCYTGDPGCITPAPVPVPAALPLFVSALLGFRLISRKPKV